MFHRKKNRFLQNAAAWLCIGLILCLLPDSPLSTVHASNKRPVKVAFFPMGGYHDKNEDGSLTGMDVEYMENLLKYADWKLEFVECGSWDEALQLLSNREVDLVILSALSPHRETVLWPMRTLRP